MSVERSAIVVAEMDPSNAPTAYTHHESETLYFSTIGLFMHQRDAVRQILLKRAARAGLKGTLVEPVSPHGLRAGFVTTAYRNGVPDEGIMGHTRHRSLTTMRSYVRRAKLGRASPAGKIGL